MPQTRREFWEDKIGKNQQRDLRVAEEVLAYGWRRAVVWECSVRGRSDEALANVADAIAEWVRSGGPTLTIPDQEHEPH
jgi:DNA mismatch endonuclease (patch repair protein)